MTTLEQLEQWEADAKHNRDPITGGINEETGRILALIHLVRKKDGLIVDVLNEMILNPGSKTDLNWCQDSLSVALKMELK